MSEKCKHTKDDGKKCQAWAIKGGDFCYMHEPKRSADREAARRKGGRTKARLSQVKDIVKKAVENLPEIRECKFQTLDDIQLAIEDQLFYIEKVKKYAVLSQADRVLSLRICDAIVKVLCLKGLDAESRISAMEDQILGNLFDTS